MSVPVSLENMVRLLVSRGLGWEDICVQLKIASMWRPAVRAIVLKYPAPRGLPGAVESSVGVPAAGGSTMEDER
jgi:hypothetical protein